MAERVEVIALHGFLGLPGDWRGVEGALAAISPGRDIVWTALDCGQYLRRIVTEGTPQARSLIRFGEILGGEIAARSDPVIMVGYSMGGRLALHTLLNSPSAPAGAVVVSAQPGLSDELSRRSRLTSDEAWAVRFEQEAWGDLIAAWNESPVFRSSREVVRPCRIEGEFDRPLLAESLRAWSLGHQEDLRGGVGALTCPLDILVGGEDVKLCAAWAGFPVTVVPGAGHRLLLEAPTAVAAAVAGVIRRIQS